MPFANWDVFVLKMDISTSSLDYSTFIGGNFYERGTGIYVDANGNVTVTGCTDSTDFPTTPGSYDTSKILSDDDVFIFRLNALGDSLIFSTFVGGRSRDIAYAIDCDDSGCPYITGQTTSSNFPTSTDAYNGSLSGWDDIFVLKLNQSGDSLEYSTYIGGSKWEYGYDIFVDQNGCAIVTGFTNSWDFPTTKDAYDRTYNDKSDLHDIIITKISANGTSLLYSSYYGGQSDEIGRALDVDSGGCIYVTGGTSSTNFPTTPGVINRSLSGPTDLFVLKLDIYIPELGKDSTRSWGTTGDEFTFNISISDNHMVANATVEFWYGNSSDHENLSMSIVSGTPDNGIWGTTAVLLSYSIEPFRYIFHVLDASGNGNRTWIRNVTITDNDCPIFNDTTQSFATTGDPFAFKAGIVDNIGVSAVRVVYWFGNNQSQGLNVSMKGIDLTQFGNGTYIFDELIVPGNSLDPLSYFFIAEDLFGNQNRTEINRIQVIDNDSVEFLDDNSDMGATTGDIYRFNVSVTDNIGVDGVFVNYWFNGRESESVNASLVGVNQTGIGNGTYVHTIQKVPTDSIEPFFYQFHSVDVWGNWNASRTRRIAVTDNDKPNFISDLSDEKMYLGMDFTFNTSLFDNIGIRNVTVFYWFDNQTATASTMAGQDITGYGNGTYRLTISVPTAIVQVLHYYFNATDPSGNWNSTIHSSVPTNDVIKPWFGEDLSLKEAIKGMPYTFGIVVFDNIAVYEVYLEFTINDIKINASIDGEGTYSHEIVIPRIGTGFVQYSFSCRDLFGNWNATTMVEIPLTNEPPTASEMPIWVITEGVEDVLDLAQYLFDENDPIESLVVECDALDIQVDGSTLRAYYDEWNPDHTISISISDGEDSIQTTITIHIVNVNDPPHILTNLGTINLMEDVPFNLSISAEDEDGDTLAWSDDSDLFEIDALTGAISFTPSQDSTGHHQVTIIVSDDNGGSDEISIGFRIIVVNDPPLIVEIIPSSGSRFHEGTRIQFSVTVSDEEGDDLIIEWKSGDKTIGTGEQFEYDRLSKGPHSISVYVSDGNATIMGSIDIEIFSGSISIGPTSILGLIIFIMIIIGVSFVLKKILKDK